MFHEECAVKEAKEAKAVSEAAEAEAAASEAPATTPLIKKRKTKKTVVFLCVRCTHRATRGAPLGGGNDAVHHPPADGTAGGQLTLRGGVQSPSVRHALPSSETPKSPPPAVREKRGGGGGVVEEEEEEEEEEEDRDETEYRGVIVTRTALGGSVWYQGLGCHGFGTRSGSLVRTKGAIDDMLDSATCTLVEEREEEERNGEAESNGDDEEDDGVGGGQKTSAEKMSRSPCLSPAPSPVTAPHRRRSRRASLGVKSYKGEL